MQSIRQNTMEKYHALDCQAAAAGSSGGGTGAANNPYALAIAHLLKNKGAGEPKKWYVVPKLSIEE